MKNTIKFLKTKDVETPTYGTTLSAGIDFFVPNDFESIHILPGEYVCIPSGIKVKFDEHYALIAFNKSGISLKKNLQVGASIVDSDYQGEIHLHLINIGTTAQQISPGDKIIQFVYLPTVPVNLEEVNSLEELYPTQSERGEGAFGSTGKRAIDIEQSKGRATRETSESVDTELITYVEDLKNDVIQTTNIENQLMFRSIDFDKVKDIEDIKNILKSLDITFSSDYKNLEKIKPYLK
jgi:dUTP pyrophosphatase